VRIIRGMGRAAAPGPYFSTMILGAYPIFDIGTEEQKQKYLPKIAMGDIKLTME